MTTPTRIYRRVIPPPPPTSYSTSKYFHIFYTTLFYLLYIALLGLILVTPGDAIRQALQNKQLYNVFVIAAAYFVTAFLAGLIYASRIYTTRSVLSGIPRGYVPVEEGDVKEKVRRVVRRGLGRSAGVAWLARPRAMQCKEGTNALCLAEEIEERRERTTFKRPKLAKRVLRKLLHKKPPPGSQPGSRRPSTSGAGAHKNITASCDAFGHPIVLPLPDDHRPASVRKKTPDHGNHIWGHISHPGWSPPTSHDLPNLHYQPVIAELPHLVEAKVVALSGPTEENLALLTRPVSEGLREYLRTLVELGCLDPPEPHINGVLEEEKAEDKLDDVSEAEVDWKQWLIDYEYARFSGEPVSEDEFRALMSGFASLLRSIRGLDGQVAGEEDFEASDWDEGEAYSVNSKSTGSSKSARSAPAEVQPIQSELSPQSFEEGDDGRSVRTSGTAGTVEKRADISPQLPSYLSSPMPDMYTPQPRTPSPRRLSSLELSRLEEVRSKETEASHLSQEGTSHINMGYVLDDMADSPASFIRRPPSQPHSRDRREQEHEHQQPEMTERIRLGVKGGMSQADTESMRSFDTESDMGSIIRHEFIGNGVEAGDALVERLQAPLQVPLPGGRGRGVMGVRSGGSGKDG